MSKKKKKTSGVLPITPYPRIPADLCDHNLRQKFSAPLKSEYVSLEKNSNNVHDFILIKNTELELKDFEGMV